MSFNIGDRVRPIDDRDFSDFGEGTVVRLYGDDDDGCYIDWDTENHYTYSNSFRIDGILKEYLNVYMMYNDRLELTTSTVDRATLPSDPRLRGICLKIRELDSKFKQRQQAKLAAKVKDARVTISRTGDITSSTEGRTQHRATVVTTSVAQGTAGHILDAMRGYEAQIEGFFDSSEATANSY